VHTAARGGCCGRARRARSGSNGCGWRPRHLRWPSSPPRSRGARRVLQTGPFGSGKQGRGESRQVQKCTRAREGGGERGPDLSELRTEHLVAGLFWTFDDTCALREMQKGEKTFPGSGSIVERVRAARAKSGAIDATDEREHHKSAGGVTS
jgi:hypothetical protein